MLLRLKVLCTPKTTLICTDLLASCLQLFTKAWTAGLLNGLGDLVSQKFVEKTDNLDFKRLGIFTLLVSHPSVLTSLCCASQSACLTRELVKTYCII